MSNNPVVTVEYLLNHGFIQYNSVEEGDVCDIPFEGNEDSLNFREIEFDRQMFVVIFSSHNGDPASGYGKYVWVQEDAGCGFVEIPFPWWDLPIEYFESVYYGIRGHKPKFTGPPSEEISYEIVSPKQLKQPPL